ncbi:hypothetical protein GGI25_003821 [Coemansia spiralis]|uniref:Pre-mRNA processing factor 4 (PRP4)-like domain-containing protein n=2 Tax=Coemansia TaxID=4863 RepID=A0A9W8G679_9FUNG|nr:WD40-repeat-containing domain protein [Coemansia spiralis]KAJ1990968.1 hypothetical protein EDC05_003688 [Coemansia umbellata]KAJ2620978.1 hypothetical protein GGI26_004478 [Coemansia sp. RSA 1358]KAJ2675727.1 hypothetical protein GGI25_003821 [Coemansia spiralis]
MSNSSKKERIHFGTLEREAVALAKRKRQEEDDQGEDGRSGEDMLVESARNQAASSIDLSLIDEVIGDTEDQAFKDEALEKRRQAMEEFERKKLARAIAVPTDDRQVKMELRGLGHPICLFGEDAGDRRNRLRYALSKMAMEQKSLSKTVGDDAKSAESGIIQTGREGSAEGKLEEEEEEEDEEENEDEEFYTEGTEELRRARQNIAAFSLARAHDRLEKQRKNCNADLALIRKRRQNLIQTLQTYSIYGSQVSGERPLSRVVFSADCSSLLAGSWSGSIKLWNVPQCQEIRSYRGHTDRVGGLSFRPQTTDIAKTGDSEQNIVDFVSGGADNSVYLWSLNKETPIGKLLGHQSRVVNVAFHPSGNFVGSASYDGSWRLWDVLTERELLLQEGHSREVFCLRFQCDGALVATAGLDGVGRVWDLRSGRSVMTLEGHAKEIFGIDWSPNGYQVATGSADNTVRIFDLRKLKSIYQIPAHKSMVTDVRFFHGLPPHAVRDSSMMDEDEVDKPDDQETNVQLCSGQYLATASNDGLVNIWSAGDWKLQKSLTGHVGKVMSVDIANDGSFIASAGYDRTFKLWGPEDLP